MAIEEKVGTQGGDVIDSSATIYLGLGSNLGDRERNLHQATRRIESLQIGSEGFAISRTSAIYESEPVGYSDQPWFLNQVVEVKLKPDLIDNGANDSRRAQARRQHVVRPALRASELLEALLEIEHTMGRVRAIRDGPRLIDIDILVCGDLVGVWPRDGSPANVERNFLILPHPRMPLRRFVLEPLCELAPDLIHPTLGKPMRELLGALGESQAVRRFVGEDNSPP